MIFSCLALRWVVVVVDDDEDGAVVVVVKKDCSDHFCDVRLMAQAIDWEAS